MEMSRIIIWMLVFFKSIKCLQLTYNFAGKEGSTQIINDEGESSAPVFELSTGVPHPTLVPQGALVEPTQYFTQALNFEHSGEYSFEVWVYFYDREINRIYVANTTIQPSGSPENIYFGTGIAGFESVPRWFIESSSYLLESENYIQLGWVKLAFLTNSSDFLSYQYDSIDLTKFPGSYSSQSTFTTSTNALGCYSRCDSSQFLIHSVRFRDDAQLGIVGNSFSYNTTLATCGDGIVQAGNLEQCDDGHDSSPGCDEGCQLEIGYSCGKSPYHCFPAQCGDGYYAIGEECDDQNSANDDGCNNSCIIEFGFECDALENSTCTAICGDGIKIASHETCEDGNGDDNDGCSSNCIVESDYTCDGWTSSLNPDTCDTICGNGIQNPNVMTSLTCDDGNVTPGDGCDENCLVESGWTCLPGGASTCSPICGTGERVSLQECDDGNVSSGDGCSQDCIVEEDFYCEQLDETAPSVCKKCEVNQEFTSSKIISRCKNSSDPESPSVSQSATTGTKIATGISTGAIIGVSLLNMSSLAGIWSLVSQFQLFLLLILTKNPFPEEINQVILGNSIMTFDLGVLGIDRIPKLGQAKQWSEVPQSNLYLKEIGVESQKSLNNNFEFFTSLGSLVAIYPLVMLLKCCKRDLNNSKKGFLDKVMTGVISLFNFGIYIRMVVEGFQLLLLSSISELKSLPLSFSELTISNGVACLIILLCMFALFCSFYIFYTTRHSFDSEGSYALGEFTTGISEKKYSTIYSFIALIRRTLIISWLVIFQIMPTVYLSLGIFVIQFIYLIFMVILKPFERCENNLIEIINEFIFLSLACMLCVFTTKSKWEGLPTRIFTSIILSNSVIITFIMLGALVISVKKRWKGKKKEEVIRVIPARIQEVRNASKIYAGTEASQIKIEVTRA